MSESQKRWLKATYKLLNNALSFLENALGHTKNKRIEKIIEVIQGEMWELEEMGAGNE